MTVSISVSHLLKRVITTGKLHDEGGDTKNREAKGRSKQIKIEVKITWK